MLETGKDESVMADITMLSMYAKKGCRRCYGRGFIGKNVKTNELTMCRCFDFTKEVVHGSDEG